MVDTGRQSGWHQAKWLALNNIFHKKMVGCRKVTNADKMLVQTGGSYSVALALLSPLCCSVLNQEIALRLFACHVGKLLYLEGV